MNEGGETAGAWGRLASFVLLILLVGLPTRVAWLLHRQQLPLPLGRVALLIILRQIPAVIFGGFVAGGLAEGMGWGERALWASIALSAWFGAPFVEDLIRRFVDQKVPPRKGGKGE